MADMQRSTYFQPTIEWIQDPTTCILRIYLPGFRKDEIKVEVDNSGKLTVRGRLVVDGKFMRLEQVFEVPKDSHINKISGKFEGECLFLFMPKKVMRETEAPQRAVSPKKPRGEEPTQKEKPVSGDKKEEAPTQRDQPKSSERKEEENIMPKDREETKAAAPVYEEKPLTDEKKVEAPTQKDQPKSSERKEEEPIQKEEPKDGSETKAAAPVYEEKPLTDKNKGEGPTQKDQPKSTKRKEEEPIQKEKPKDGEETKAAALLYKERPLTCKEKEEHLIEVEPIGQQKPMRSTVSEDRFEKYKKNGMDRKETIAEVEGWLDYGLIDELLEMISKNKKVIAVAVTAFSIGFYVSQKLRSNVR